MTDVRVLAAANVAAVGGCYSWGGACCCCCHWLTPLPWQRRRLTSHHWRILAMIIKRWQAMAVN